MSSLFFIRREHEVKAMDAKHPAKRNNHHPKYGYYFFVDLHI